ncbi:hypothetical protein [Pseudomonas sp. DWP3-1-2]|uniref:hypothetical protein n=1 Tax=Pseudomonas sp. DWP3-1-2 TaxID=2804645 RepID=UPI003CEF1DCF
MGISVSYKIGEMTHFLDMAGSVPSDSLSLKKLVAQHLGADDSPATVDEPDLTPEQFVDARLSHAGVTDFQIHRQ